ncbi:hypothetical protein [Enterococcus moraviensis]|nr:hypothetical protein [Enterococcus moraviensis]
MAIKKDGNHYKIDVSLGIDPITKKQRRIRISGKKVRGKVSKITS